MKENRGKILQSKTKLHTEFNRVWIKDGRYKHSFWSFWGKNQKYLFGYVLYFCVASVLLRSDLPAVLGPEPHGGGHAGVVPGVFAPVFRL